MAERKRKELLGVVKRGERSYWTRIGAAFENSDGSWNLVFDYFPSAATTTVQMREPKAKEEGRGE